MDGFILDSEAVGISYRWHGAPLTIEGEEDDHEVTIWHYRTSPLVPSIGDKVELHYSDNIQVKGSVGDWSDIVIHLVVMTRKFGHDYNMERDSHSTKHSYAELNCVLESIEKLSSVA